MYDQGDGFSQGYGGMFQRQVGYGQEGFGRKFGLFLFMYEDGGYGRLMFLYGYQD